MNLPAPFDHPAFSTVVGTLVGYGVILAIMTTLLFLIPFVFFSTF
jgi:hypothetical protein